MPVYTVNEMESLIRAAIDEPSQARITSADILRVFNDACKEIAIKTLCIEKEIYVTAKTGERIIPFNGIKINYARVNSLILFYSSLIALTVPAVPTVTVPATGVIAETPVATGPISLTVPAVPTVSVSTTVI